MGEGGIQIFSARMRYISLVGETRVGTVGGNNSNRWRAMEKKDGEIDVHLTS